MQHETTTSAIIFHSGEEEKTYLFPEKVTACLEAVSSFLGHNHTLHAFPDMALKTFGLPTGLAITSPLHDTILMPCHLRDPGCGYLTFKAEFSNKSSELQTELGNALQEIVAQNLKNNSFFERYFATPNGIKQVLARGPTLFESSIENQKFLSHSSFSAEELPLTNEELTELHQDFLNVTNTVEFKTIQDIQDNNKLNHYNIHPQSLVGFIHSGCHLFPQILAKRFLQRIMDYTYKNHMADLKTIGVGIYGVHLHSELGQEYFNWLKAAMNYALANRYAIYLSIKEQLEKQFKCQLTLLSDVMHAGITVTGNTVKSLRGAQDISGNPDLPLLIAGQRETVSALVSKGNNSQQSDQLIPHGTSYEEAENSIYLKFFNKEFKNKIIEAVQKVHYNTDPEINKVLPYTYNLLKTIQHFENKNIIKPIATLAPYINIHSPTLQRMQS